MSDALIGGADEGAVERRYDGWTDLLVFHKLMPDVVAGAAIRLKIADLEGEWSAMVDTGAQWSVMPYEVAELLEINVDGSQQTVYRTRFGHIEGVVVTHSIRLEAREGQGIHVDADWFVSDQWPERVPMIVGWTGFLSAIAFGCDPGTKPGGQEKFFFAQL